MDYGIISPEQEAFIYCPNCNANLRIHKLDDRIICTDCFMAWSRDEDTGQMEFAYQSFKDDIGGSKYFCEVVG